MIGNSEVYFLQSSTRQDGIRLLQRAGVDGIVLTSDGNWLAILADGIPFKPNHRVTAANEGRLLHVWCSDDFGWGFTLLQNTAATGVYLFDLESGIVPQANDCDWRHIAEFAGLSANDRAIAKSIATAISPPKDSALMPCQLATAFLECLGIRQFAGLRYESIRRQTRGDQSPIVGAAMVVDGKVRLSQHELAGDLEKGEHSDENSVPTDDFDPRLLGTWVQIRVISHRGSREIPFSDQTRRFERSRLIVTNTEPPQQFILNYTVRPRKTPSEFEVIAENFSFLEGGKHGIYMVTDDELTWCWGFAKDPPPREFKASEQPRRRVDVFKRVK